MGNGIRASAEPTARREIPDRAPLLRSQRPGGRVPGLRPRSRTTRRAQALPRRAPRPSGEAEEGRALAKVVSPYVARCHGIERIDGEAYLVVEYVPGRNLAEVRRDGPLGIAEAVRILAQLAEGVAAVHARGLIHRDIKPANVILHDDGTPRLVDFGLAAHLGGSRLRELGGSPPYMAPEQARGEWDRIDFRTDIFGLGARALQAPDGPSPHAGSTAVEVLEHAKKADVTPPRQLDPTIPAPLEAVCLKALAAAPENRYTTPLEFAAALRQAIEPTRGRDDRRRARHPRPGAPGPARGGRCLRAPGAGGLAPAEGLGDRDPRRPSRYLRTGCGSAPGRDRGEPLQGAGRRPTCRCRTGRSRRPRWPATPRGSRTWCGSTSRSRARRTFT